MAKKRVKHKSPIIFKLYQFIEGKMRKVAAYRTNKGLNDKLSLYAEVMPEAQVYVSNVGEWFKVEFFQERNEHGTLVEMGWKLKKSDGVKR